MPRLIPGSVAPKIRGRLLSAEADFRNLPTLEELSRSWALEIWTTPARLGQLVENKLCSLKPNDGSYQEANAPDKGVFRYRDATNFELAAAFRRSWGWYRERFLGYRLDVGKRGPKPHRLSGGRWETA